MLVHILRASLKEGGNTMLKCIFSLISLMFVDFAKEPGNFYIHVSCHPVYFNRCIYFQIPWLFKCFIDKLDPGD